MVHHVVVRGGFYGFIGLVLCACASQWWSPLFLVHNKTLLVHYDISYQYE